MNEKSPIQIPDAGTVANLAAVFAAAPVGVMFVDGGGAIVAANPAATRILGRSTAELQGLTPADPTWAAVKPDGTPFRGDEFPAKLALDQGAVVADVVMGVFDPASRRHRWIRIHAVPLFRPGEPRPYLAYVLFDDITAARQTETRERARNRCLELVARGAALPDILEAIVRGVEAEAPAQICTILLVDAVAKCLRHGAAPGMPEYFNQAVDGLPIGVGVGSCGTAAATGQRVVVEDIASHPYWQPFTAIAARAGLGACWSEPIRSSRGRVLGTFAIYHRRPAAPGAEDIARIEAAANLASIAIEHAQTQVELERQARIDDLTGLCNRRHFWTQAENEVARALRYGGELSLLMIDVDRFKRINDTWGHKVGDLVLRALGETCRQCLREVDVIGRLGGEEFGVLLPETEGLKAVEAAERLRESIANAPVALPEGGSVNYTVSIGVTTLDGQKADLEALFGQADRALYAAKGAGRNRVCASSAVGRPAPASVADGESAQ